MTAPSRYAPLFEPIDIGPKRMRNRFMQVPQCNGGGTVRPGLQAAHRAVKAEGGWAAIFTEGCSVSLEADATPYVLATLVDDDDVRNLARMCDEIHAHGSLAGVELKYASMNALESRSRARAATVFPRSFPLQVYPRHLDLDDIALVQRYYVDAALRAREAGFDLICVYGAHYAVDPRERSSISAFAGVGQVQRSEALIAPARGEVASVDILDHAQQRRYDTSVLSGRRRPRAAREFAVVDRPRGSSRSSTGRERRAPEGFPPQHESIWWSTSQSLPPRVHGR